MKSGVKEVGIRAYFEGGGRIVKRTKRQKHSSGSMTPKGRRKPYQKASPTTPRKGDYDGNPFLESDSDNMVPSPDTPPFEMQLRERTQRTSFKHLLSSEVNSDDDDSFTDAKQEEEEDGETEIGRTMSPGVGPSGLLPAGKSGIAPQPPLP